MVASLDGFIAKKDNSIDWMKSSDNYEKGITLTEEKIVEFINSIDCYVMGSKTYEHALELGWPYGEVPVYVLTQRKLKAERKTVIFYQGNPQELIKNTLGAKFQNIWMVGGSMLTKAFIQQDLADEIILSVMPVILGDGKPFFDFIGKEVELHLKDVTAYKDGMVELCYELKKE
ncbi:dihydrofolate reductase [Flavobacteriaceae bacterium R33]|uniref:Dihydrofolate reductase n=2 Tax=Poritiphilus flavus TaxID=2697053 RepID=A0A6L9EH17_9FLAO|nr:dihydrofolate reductase [Poritiphilus flavus]